MLPEYRQLMTTLKEKNDAHFLKLFNEHNELDEQISALESDPVAVKSRANEIEENKRKKLALKDELASYLASVAEKA